VTTGSVRRRSWTYEQRLGQIPNPLERDRLVSSLHRNSEPEGAALASPTETSRMASELPRYRAIRQVARPCPQRQTNCLRERSVMIDRERFTPARRSCREPDRSVVKVPVGEPSLSPEGECLSLHVPVLAEEEKNGNAQPPSPPK